MAALNSSDVESRMYFFGDCAIMKARNLLGAIETAVVKNSHGWNSAECLPLEQSRQLIHNGVAQAVSRFKSGDHPDAFRLSYPVKMTAELMQKEMMEFVAKMGGIVCLDETRVEYSTRDMLDAFQVFREVNGIGAEALK